MRRGPACAEHIQLVLVFIRDDEQPGQSAGPDCRVMRDQTQLLAVRAFEGRHPCRWVLRLRFLRVGKCGMTHGRSRSNRSHGRICDGPPLTAALATDECAPCYQRQPLARPCGRRREVVSRSYTQGWPARRISKGRALVAGRWLYARSLQRFARVRIRPDRRGFRPLGRRMWGGHRGPCTVRRHRSLVTPVERLTNRTAARSSTGPTKNGDRQSRRSSLSRSCSSLTKHARMSETMGPLSSSLSRDRVREGKRAPRGQV